MKKYNLTDIMSRAWAIRKSAAAEIGCPVSEVVFSLCLKQAWVEATQEVSVATDILNQWQAMGDEAQYSMISRNVHAAAKNNPRKVVNKYASRDADFYTELVSETWLRLSGSITIPSITNINRKRHIKGLSDITLVSLIYRAANAAVETALYGYQKREATEDIQVTNDDGEQVNLLDLTAEKQRYERDICGIERPTEGAALINVSLSAFHDIMSGRDEIDQKIMELLPKGFSERQIAKIVGISNVAVHKRIVKMRAALESLRVA